jgi:putative phosphoribosyl transferase
VNDYVLVSEGSLRLQMSAIVAVTSSGIISLLRPLDLQVVPGATHLFEEPGALEEVGRLAADWFQRHLKQKSRA